MSIRLAIGRCVFGPRRHHEPPECTGPPPTRPPLKPPRPQARIPRCSCDVNQPNCPVHSAAARERSPLAQLMSLPPRPEATLWLLPTCRDCGHPAVAHMTRKADRGCDNIGCACRAYEPDEGRWT